MCVARSPQLNPSGVADQATFTTMYAQHYHALRDYASLRCASAEVDDVVAEAFTVAWRRFTEIPAGMERGWLFGVVKNVLRNHRRSRHRIAELHMRITAASPRVETDGMGEQLPLESREQFAGAFNSLRDEDRELLILAVWFEMTGAQLGAALGISANAATVRLHRARGRLQHALDAWTLKEPR